MRATCRYSIIIVLITAIIGSIHANVLFHFAFDFHVKSEPTASEDAANGTMLEEHINKTIAVSNNRITIEDNNLPMDNRVELDERSSEAPPLATGTSGPMTDLWARQQNLNTIADEKLRASRTAIQNLNSELIGLVGRSDELAAKAKLTTRFINTVDSGEMASVGNKFVILRQFVVLVDKLKQPGLSMGTGEESESAGAGHRTIEFMLMKLLLEKYHVLELQSQVSEQVLQAEEAWQRYVKQKLIEVAV